MVNEFSFVYIDSNIDVAVINKSLEIVNHHFHLIPQGGGVSRLPYNNIL